MLYQITSLDSSAEIKRAEIEWVTSVLVYDDGITF